MLYSPKKRQVWGGITVYVFLQTRGKEEKQSLDANRVETSLSGSTTMSPSVLHLIHHLGEVWVCIKHQRIHFAFKKMGNIFEIITSPWMGKHFLLPLTWIQDLSQDWWTGEGRCHGWWWAMDHFSLQDETVRNQKSLQLLYCTSSNGWCWGVFLNCLSTEHPSEIFTCMLGVVTPASKAIQSVTKLPFPILTQLIVSDACFSDIYHETQILTGLMHCKKTPDLQWGRVFF